MTITGYKMLTKTGGASTSADGVDGDDLLDGDFMFIMTAPTDDAFFVYAVDDDSGATERDPDVLAPATNPGSKRLILMRNIPVPIENVDVDTGTETVDTFPDTFAKGCFWDFVVSKGANLRAGVVFAVWDASGDTVQYTEVGSPDVGDTSDLVLSVDIDSDNVRLRATAASNDWLVETLRRRI